MATIFFAACFCAATIRGQRLAISPDCAATIRGRRLFEDGVYSKKYGSSSTERTFNAQPQFQPKVHASLGACSTECNCSVLHAPDEAHLGG